MRKHAGRRERGFTLLELLVATVIMGIAVVGLMAAISTSVRNASRLSDYDRATLLARSKMDELLMAQPLPLNTELSGPFDPVLLAGDEGGWRARVTPFELPPRPTIGAPALDRVELQVWWKTGGQEHTFRLDAYRTRFLTQMDVTGMLPPQ
ncbi:MAG TPA: type II secretion system protein [Bryobacteraceae bacterium]|jgi:general secretion pathway protein I|nr:type II secretion system protein [Bryobacteraceae bacterium]